MLYLFFGWPYEFRVFYEVYPVLVLLTALAAERLETWRIGYHEPNASWRRRYRRGATLLLLAALLLGFALRVLALDRLPPGLSDVEALNGVLAREWTPALLRLAHWTHGRGLPASDRRAGRTAFWSAPHVGLRWRAGPAPCLCDRASDGRAHADAGRPMACRGGGGRAGRLVCACQPEPAGRARRAACDSVPACGLCLLAGAT